MLWLQWSLKIIQNLKCLFLRFNYSATFQKVVHLLPQIQNAVDTNTSWPAGIQNTYKQDKI
jgi:hypothetical protein